MQCHVIEGASDRVLALCKGQLQHHALVGCRRCSGTPVRAAVREPSPAPAFVAGVKAVACAGSEAHHPHDIVHQPDWRVLALLLSLYQAMTGATCLMSSFIPKHAHRQAYGQPKRTQDRYGAQGSRVRLQQRGSEVALAVRQEEQRRHLRDRRLRLLGGQHLWTVQQRSKVLSLHRWHGLAGRQSYRCVFARPISGSNLSSGLLRVLSRSAP